MKQKQFIKQRIRENLITENRVAFNLPVPQDVRELKELFSKHGHELYIVGGAVRDALMGKSPKDWDLATDALPEKVTAMLKKLSIVKSLKMVGERFGIIMAVTDTDEYEIATFREDAGNQDDGEVKVKFSTIEKDVERRDLTINALFYDLSTNEIVDLVGGISDIKNKRIITVGDPADRFAEDSLRKLRAIRFAARVGSELDPSVDAALKADPSISEKVSQQPIMDEFLKGIGHAQSKVHFFNLLKKYKMWQFIIPTKLGIKLNGFVEETDASTLLAVLFQNNNHSELRKKLSGGDDTIELNDGKMANEIEFLIWFKEFTADRIFDFKSKQAVSDDQLRNFAKWVGLDSNLVEAFINHKLSIKGGDVMAKFNVKGEQVGIMKSKLEADIFKKSL